MLKFFLPRAVCFFLFAGGVAATAQTGPQQLYLQCLTNFETYAESIWHTSATVPDAGYWGDGGSTGNGGIRGNGGIAVAYATLCVALPNDPRYPNRLARVRQALNYDYNTHVSGTFNTVSGNKWGWSNGSLATCTSQGGSDWQTAEWSGSMGLACMLVQSNLPAATVAGVQTVVVSEADHRAAIPPCTRVLSSGDTKAEENAWDGNILSLAAAWMTNNASASNWLYAAKSYLVNTYTVAYPDLITPNTTGDSLSNWVSTVTIFPSYALENHGFYHPTYEMVAGMSSGDSLVMARLANPGIATQLQPFAEHNVLAVWTNNLSTLVTDTGDFAYPAGVDWAVRDFEHNSFITWMATHFNDPLARWADDKLAQCVLYHQLKNGNGTFVGTSANPGGGILFYREAVEARRTALAWLHWATADFPNGAMTAPAGTLMYNTDVQVIHQRSAFGTVSVSFNGSRTAAVIEPAALSVPTNAFIASPRVPGILGLGALGNPTSASVISFVTNADGFTAEIKIISSLGTTETYIKSTGESIAIIEVPKLNNGATASSGGSFICGIENDPLTGGARLLEWANNSAGITALSGTSRNVTNNWICVAGRYGVAAGPAGYFRYAANTTYNRTSVTVNEAGEAEDALSFVENSQLAPRYAVWFPTKNALQTSNAATVITWVTNSSTATLTFPGLNGDTNILVASLGPTPTNNSGAWSVDAGGAWSDTGNWSGGIVADGAGYTADFSKLNLTADRTVTLDASRNIGTLRFGDASGAQNWIVTNAPGSTLTLNNVASSPAIVATNTVTLAVPLAGAGGFTKSGPGTLILSGTNSLSGAVHLDSASASANDGAVRLTRSAALAGATALDIRNNSGGGAASTLQLDGAAGNLTVSQAMTNSCRANTIANVQNLAGSNTMSGGIFMQSGGSNVVLQSDAGTLVLAGNLQYVGTLTAARTFNFLGAGDTLVTAPILFSTVAPIGVLKSGAGALTLAGACTYTNGTTVNGGTLRVNGSLGGGALNIAAGTLSGTGIVGGPVNVSANATLSPGGSTPGTLMINNTLTNFGTVALRLKKTGTALTNDTLQGISVFAFGGQLTLTNIGTTALAAGDTFKLFSAANYTGAFAGISPVTPGAGLLWVTNNLNVNGTLSIVSVPQVQGWGANDFGQSVVPPGLSNNVAVIAAGGYHNLALLTNGSIVAWGDNFNGQGTVPANVSNVVAIAAGGYHSLAALPDGTVIGWGANDSNQISIPASATNVVALEGGDAHSLALRADGTVVAWGDDSWGQSDVPAGITNVISIAAGGQHSLALKLDGTVTGWGGNLGPFGNYAGQATVPANLNNVVAVAAGGFHSLALKADGTVTGWGDNSSGQLNLPTGLTNAVAIAAGYAHSLALRADGSLAAWGDNTFGQAPLNFSLAPIATLAAGNYHNLIMLGALPGPPQILSAACAGGAFTVAAQTWRGKAGVLLYKNSLLETNWQFIGLTSGDGTVKPMTDPAAKAPLRFYRMLAP